MTHRLKLLIFLAAICGIFSFASFTQAALNAVDPGPYTAATGFFPVWYQDTNGMGLDLCLSKTVSPLGGFMCVLLPNPGVFDPALPISFPGNFPDESFWFTADGRVTGTGIDVRFTIALEAAFATGAVINGDQTSFARIRVRGNVPTPGVYTLTHPYGVEVLDITGTGTKAINYTRDIGIGAHGVFTGPLAGDIGPFLVRTDALGNPSPIVIGTEIFLGDPNVTQTVTGSPFATNYLRVQGPGGIDVLSNLFAISGKVFTGAVFPTPLVVDRASYSRTAVGTQMDVFAIAPATATLSFTDTGAPPVVVPMAGDTLGRFFGPTPVPPASIGSVTLTGNNIPFNLATFPANVTTTKSSPVTDVVYITKAEYSVAAQTLVIEASSSDETPPPTLSYGAAALAMTAAPPVQSLTVTGLVAPPAEVTVTSSAGGSDTEQIVVLP